MIKTRLLLVGGGHAHVEVVRQFGTRELPLDVHLISPESGSAYSGMLPGVVAGTYAESEIRVDLRALCRRSGVTFLEDSVLALDLANQQVDLQSKGRLRFDILSLNVGSLPDRSCPGSQTSGVPVKPVSGFLQALRSLPPECGIVVVGGGAGGVELSLALRRRVPNARLNLVTASQHVLPGHSWLARTLCARALRRRSVQVHKGCRVDGVDSARVFFEPSGSLPYDALVWATGARPLPWLARSGLAVDQNGFVQVHPSLQSISHPLVFAAGDTCAIHGCPCPKAGVFAVRQGPILAENLFRVAQGGGPVTELPSNRRFLSLISYGDGVALASWGGLALESRLCWYLKDSIDRAWMRKYASGEPAQEGTDGNKRGRR